MSAANGFSILKITRNEQLLNWLAWLLPLSLAGGSDLLAFEWLGASWYAFRCIVVVGALLAAADCLFVRRALPFWMWSWVFACFIWIGGAILNRSETMDIALWQKGMFYLVLGIAALASVYHLSSSGKNATMVVASVAGLAVNVVVACVQLVSSIRPDSAFARELIAYSSEHVVRFAPSGLFGNPNHFAMYLCTQLFLIYSFRSCVGYTVRMVMYALSGVLILLTHSKVAEVAAIMLLVLMVVENRNWLAIQWARSAKVVFIIVAFAIAVFVSHSWVNTRNLALEVERSNNTLKYVKASSEGSRMELLKCGTDMLRESNYMGVGIGQFAQVVHARGCDERTGGIVNSHCGYIEVAAESGLLVCVTWLIAIVAFLWDSIRNPWALQCFVWVAFLSVLQFANSTFVSTPVAWFLLAWPLMNYFHRENS